MEIIKPGPLAGQPIKPLSQLIIRPQQMAEHSATAGIEQIHCTTLQLNRSQHSQTFYSAGIDSIIVLAILVCVMFISFHIKRHRSRQPKNQLHTLQTQQQKLQFQYEQLQEKHKEIKQKNQYLQSILAKKNIQLEEKELLLQEIHHRVNNNLQIVISLLDAQVNFLNDKIALEAIYESQNRVKAISLLHKKLFHSEGVTHIYMSAYIEEIITYLRDSRDNFQLVSFQLSLEDIKMHVTQALPLGLIINEAITNAFKYAFPKGRPGTISISLHRLSDKSYELTIADDGIGLPKDYDPESSRTLGMTLLHGFSEQLGGKLQIEGSSGTKINLLFTINVENLVNRAQPMLP